MYPTEEFLKRCFRWISESKDLEDPAVFETVNAGELLSAMYLLSAFGFYKADQYETIEDPEWWSHQGKSSAQYVSKAMDFVNIQGKYLTVSFAERF